MVCLTKVYLRLFQVAETQMTEVVLGTWSCFSRWLRLDHCALSSEDLSDSSHHHVNLQHEQTHPACYSLI